MVQGQIVAVERLAKDRGNVPLGAIVVGPHLGAGALRESPRPVRQSVSAGHLRRVAVPQIDGAPVEVPLKRDAVRGGRSPIGPKAALPHPGCVARFVAVRKHRGSAVIVFAVDAEEAFRAERPAVASASETSLLVARSARDQKSLRAGRALRDDVDDTVDRVGPPHRGSRTPDHLDLLDVLHERVLDVPKDARIERRIHAPPVHEHEELVRHGAVEAAGGDRVAPRVDAGHLDARDVSQRLGNADDAHPTQIVGGNHVYGGRRLGDRLRLLRNRGHLQVE
jgi:hypothetical protein